jgi:arginase
VALIGAPGDLGGSDNRGAARGPAALRDAGLAAALQRQHYAVIDRGDIAGFATTGGRTIDGCHHLIEVADSCRRVRDTVAASLDAGEVPLLLGGDHSLAMGSLAAVARHSAERNKPLFVLWLDAHADFNTPASSPTGKLYGMPAAVAVGEGHDLLLNLGHATPMLEIARIAQVGVRSIDPLEEVRIAERGLAVFRMTEVRRRGMQAVMDDALAPAVRSGAHLHVSFDIDFLDPAVAPGVSLAEADGPSLEEATTCMAAIAATGLLGSFDVVEMNPRFDPNGTTAKRVVGLLESAFARADSGVKPRSRSAATGAE